ncbi:hypothetical protein TVAG_464790 [Trichomonas vaginalis G3]|uniref:Uncharacterized protein n=1 Tax=Trichomonas vaginalis (strain ATCC PRA-98 / G3) TaxID=412133 RepID=A2EEM4_TRIV3|nr:hypothetical protein TVAGG3_1055090 [Trichomonas vaginalis G3]EAY08931.1 hypothetical protein TVAG_464790 [Trichomonas vaginalis G3]KAI5494397.1 hypothetical protein TVAGG3_1055090 [Trichomonas vaginalis G3]|eukprot:XP_001321154.1 hypothetical protein [Trichomonas vaginalis G3]
MIRSLNPIILADSNSLLEKKIDISQLDHFSRSSKSSNGKSSPSDHKNDDIQKIEIKKSPVLEFNSNNEEKSPFLEIQNKNSPKASRTSRSRSHIYDAPQLKLSSFINYPEAKNFSPKSKNSLLELFNLDNTNLEKKQNKQKIDHLELKSKESDHNSGFDNELSLSIPYYENLPLETLAFKENSNHESDQSKNCLNSDDSLTLIMTNNENSKKKHVPPPRLNFSPISSDDSDTESRELQTEELYEKFYRKHRNEITTPHDAKYYVLQHKKDRSTRKMKIRNA